MGQNEDYSPGDSNSDSSEKLLQRGRGQEGQYICDFGEGGVHAIIFQKFSAGHVKVTASHEEQSLMIFVVFWM